MSLQGFSSRRLQGFHRTLQAFGIGTPPARILAGITISDDDKIFICDGLNNKILVYQLDGTKIDEWGITGTANGELDQPSIISWYDSELFIFDGTGRMQVFSETGTWDRTILTVADVHMLTDVYNGNFYVIEATSSPALSYSFKKYDTDGTLVSSFNKSDIYVWTTNYETANLRFFANIPQDGTWNDFSEPTYQRFYTVDDDGTIIDTWELEDYDAGEEPLFISILSVDGSYVYQAFEPYIRKHTTGGAFFDSEDTGISSGTRSWVGIQKHTDGFIYLTANYADPATNSKVQVYRADTLAFDSEWTAT